MRIAGARLTVCLAVLLTLSACAQTRLRPAAVTPPGPTPEERLAAADRLVRAGCLECPLEAYPEYQALRSISSAGNVATMGAIRAAGLIALRQRELGMADEGYLAAANSETLAADPRASDALLGKVRALTYLGRQAEAIAAVDQLLGERWHLGDARYWRALNEAQLARNDEAWDDVEEAAKLLINAEVPKLAGLIAYRRQQLDVSRMKFEESRQRNPLDCEATFYLGVVLGDQRAWTRTADVLREAAQCLEAAGQESLKDIVAIRASTDPPDRRVRQIARREAQIADGRRMIVTSWFNTAVAYFSLFRKDEAWQFAEKVTTDEQFGERAREILARLNK
jgi:tetratricopeptide (TPR) repeat protein